MSLNKLTSDTPIKEWMHIGADSINCNTLTLAGEVIKPPLVYSTTSSNFSGSIFPAITTIIYGATAGLGTLTSLGYTAGDQLRIVTRGIVNSAGTTNNISFYLYGSGQISQIQIPWTSWAVDSNIVVESIYNFTSSTEAHFYSTVYLPGQIQNISYPVVTFPGLVPYDLSIAASATGTASFTHVQTTITLI